MSPTAIGRFWILCMPRIADCGTLRIGIDIIERGAGRAIDELVIDLPDPELVDLLLAEIGEVEGVDVENIRPLAGPPPDPAVMALSVANRVRSVPEDDPGAMDRRGSGGARGGSSRFVASSA